MDTSQYMSMFIEESLDNLQTLNESLLELEQNPEDIDKVNEIFRVAHTIKGMAATMGFNDLAELTHKMEDVLSRFSKKIDRDLFVLPSSIHEVIIVPKTDFITKDELKTMVCEVNASEVDECDRLSDNVYIFEKNGNTLSIA